MSFKDKVINFIFEYTPEESEEEREKRRKRVKATLAKIQRFKKSKFLYLVCFFFSLSITYTTLLSYKPSIVMSDNLKSIIIFLFYTAIVSVLLFLFIYCILEYFELFEQSKLLDLEADILKNEVENEDVFENSIKMSYKYLDQYYHQTRAQAQKGFLITLCVAITGFLLIGGGVIAMFLEKTTPAYITCAAGVITEFVSSVFFYLYNKTVTSMSKYHDKLVLSHNVSVALKVADSLPEELKHEAKQNIINEIVKDVNNHLINSKE